MEISVTVYVVAQLIAGSLLLCALVEAMCSRAVPSDFRVARMGLLYFPFFIVSAIGALARIVVLAAANALAPTSDDFKRWHDAYIHALASVHPDIDWQRARSCLRNRC